MWEHSVLNAFCHLRRLIREPSVIIVTEVFPKIGNIKHVVKSKVKIYILKCGMK